MPSFKLMFSPVTKSFAFNSFQFFKVIVTMIEFRNIHIKSFNYSTRQAKRTGQNTSFPRFHCSCAIYRNRTPSDQGKAKVDLREKPARLSGLCFWWTCSTCLILHLRHRKARRWKRGQPLHRPSCHQIARASASPRRCRPGAPHGSSYCERAPCLERARRGRAR